MVRVEFLLTAFVLLVLAVMPTGAAIADETDCSPQFAVAGLCPEATGAINNGGVDLSAGYDAGGGGGEQSGGRNDARGDAGAGPGSGTGTGTGTGGQQGAAPTSPSVVVVRDGFTVVCDPGAPCDPNLVVRFTDLVNFKPAEPTQGMEPRGWSVIGLPANFIAAASVHSRSGLLLGFPAEVRFTPVGYRWSYGDGSALDSPSGGATWAYLGQAEFSDTPTSHEFSRSGSYSVSLVVVYSAEYRFAGRAWRGVPGTLSVAGAPISVVIGEARTVLVDRACGRVPAGPGC